MVHNGLLHTELLGLVALHGLFHPVAALQVLLKTVHTRAGRLEPKVEEIVPPGISLAPPPVSSERGDVRSAHQVGELDYPVLAVEERRARQAEDAASCSKGPLLWILLSDSQQLAGGAPVPLHKPPEVFLRPILVRVLHLSLGSAERFVDLVNYDSVPVEEFNRNALVALLHLVPYGVGPQQVDDLAVSLREVASQVLPVLALHGSAVRVSTRPRDPRAVAVDSFLETSSSV
mmetsp:Transcript_18680/g.34613  ORF Transcript_18680/g.34613 Transcript_18680/m.34613 type:complete len:232 (+) Transcript_18680:740-1435(+)